MNIGDKINTPHGEVHIVGFERFDSNDNTAPLSNIYIGHERIICKLLPGHTWPVESEYYALFTHEFKELNQ